MRAPIAIAQAVGESRYTATGVFGTSVVVASLDAAAWVPFFVAVISAAVPVSANLARWAANRRAAAEAEASNRHEQIRQLEAHVARLEAEAQVRCQAESHGQDQAPTENAGADG